MTVLASHTPVHPAPVVVHRAAAGAAIGFLVLQMCAVAGWIDWVRIESIVGAPWDQVLNPLLGPKMLLMLAAQGIGFLAVAGLGWLLSRPFAVAWAGRVPLVVARRFIGLAWIAVAAALYLLLTLDRSLLRAQFTLAGGDPVVLTMPTLLGVIVFGLAALRTMPDPAARLLPVRLERTGGLLLFLITAGVLAGLDRLVAGDPRPWDQGPGRVLLAQGAIVGTGLYVVLAVGEGLRAAWRDAHGAPRPGRVWTAAAIGRSVAWGGVLLTPLAAVLVGIWVALAYTPPTASVVVDRDGDLLQIYHPNGEFRIRARHGEVSPWVLLAAESIEDPGLLASPGTHPPLQPIRVAGIFTGAADLLNGEGALSGGSTIAAQICKQVSDRPLVGLVARALAPLPDAPVLPTVLLAGATVAEKFAWEFPCAFGVEEAALLRRDPDRAPVLLWLNEVYFGQGAYGIQAAALTYFAKSAGELTVPEAALLAGLPQAPSSLDPWSRPDDVLARRNQVLFAMARQGYLTPAEAEAFAEEPLGVAESPVRPLLRGERVVQRAMAELERHGLDGFSTAGRDVTTTIDLAVQEAVDAAALRVIAEQSAGGVNDGGVIVLDPRTGEIRALFGGTRSIGGEDAMPDMAWEEPHAPGSSIKPLLFACSLEAGVLEPDELLDDPGVAVIAGEQIADWDGEAWGSQPAAAMLAGSRNVPAAELVRRLTPRGFARCLRETFGIASDLEPDRYGVRLGLGLAPITLEELAGAYAVLANGGYAVTPTAVRGVRDIAGAPVYEARPPKPRRVLGCGTVAWIAAALAPVAEVLGLPAGVAAKTGTTDASSAVAGFSADWVVVAWLGQAEAKRGPLAVAVVWPGAAAILQELASGPLGDADGVNCNEDDARRTAVAS